MYSSLQIGINGKYRSIIPTARQEVISQGVYVAVYHTELPKLIRQGKHALR